MAPLDLPSTTSDDWDAICADVEGISGYWIQRLNAHETNITKKPRAAQLNTMVEGLTTTGMALLTAVVELQKRRAETNAKYAEWYEDYSQERARMAQLAQDMDEEMDHERGLRADLITQLEQATEAEANQRWMLEESRRELQAARLECRRAWAEVARLEEQQRQYSEWQLSGHSVTTEQAQALSHEKSFDILPVQADETLSVVGNAEIADVDLQKRLEHLEVQYWAQHEREHPESEQEEDDHDNDDNRSF
ncbi:hypothetical protein V1514DRAFT_197650 [Lipomyces japonicus]|uniref:uncharacterized protein n=1 Tax=Lipomyces japonicus TaxID=56871 RepID=UPI0034CEDB4C